MFADLPLGELFAKEEVPESLYVLFGVEGNAVSLEAVASGAPCFLIIALEAFRHIVVDNVADVGFVNPHAKGNRRDNDVTLLLQEGILVVGARLGVEPRVVG